MLHQGDEYGQEKERHCSLFTAGWRESTRFNTINLLILIDPPSSSNLCTCALLFGEKETNVFVLFTCKYKQCNYHHFKCDGQIVSFFFFYGAKAINQRSILI